MARDGVLFSIIIPSVGNRPKALQVAVNSVENAARFAGLETGQLEILIGFDGVRGKTPRCAYPVKNFNLPRDNHQGNGIRSMLVRLAMGEKLIFLDDDNVLKPYALSLYLKHFDTEMIIGRIDTQLAFDAPHLPAPDTGNLLRPGNIDPLCLCVSRRLVERCGGWQHKNDSQAAFSNISSWHNRAHSVTVLEDVVGVFDAGRSLDNSALSRRQKDMLDRLAAERARDIPMLSQPIADVGVLAYSQA